MSPILIIKVYLILICVSLANSSSIAVEGDCNNYDAFLTNCSRLPDANTTVYEERKAAYILNCQMVLDQNAKYSRNESSFCLRLYCNSADVPQGQEGTLLGLRTYTFSPVVATFLLPGDVPIGASSLPSSLNYVLMGKVTTVKDQGSCGSCWSFAATAMYQSQLLKRNFSYGLSEEAVLECTSYYAPNQRENNCKGGYFPDSLTFLAAVGNVLRSSYPYIAGTYSQNSGPPHTPGICSQTSRIMVGSGSGKMYTFLTAIQLKTLLNSYGPVMVGFYANRGFMLYSGGILSSCPNYSALLLNHAVLLVGYNDATSSWLIKNQWGTKWGEDGYARVAYSNDCGLTTIIGIVEFSSENADPKVTVSPSELRSGSSHQAYIRIVALFVMMIVLLVI